MSENTELERLEGLTVPTIANAVELFHVAPPNTGFNRAQLTCHFPDFGMAVGYAVTLTAVTDEPAVAIDEPEYWKWLEDQQGPKLAVVEDLSPRPGGAMWGEWNSHVHRALGCVGTVTQGAVRDLDALERLGFHTFATSVSVAHGYGAFVDFGAPATVAGLTIETGDLLVADLHGVLRIPREIPIPELVAAGHEIDRLESEIFAHTRSREFSVESLAQLQESVLARWPRGPHTGAI